MAGIDAGARFFAGYPISPATEIAELCSSRLPQYDGIYIQMEDEIASIAAVIGASLGGMKAFTATSGPGLVLMLENLGFAVMAEVPCVIVNIQRFGPSTGIATSPSQGDLMTSRWGVTGDHSLIVLAPFSVQECYELTIEAFNLAERFRSPVIVLADAALAHLREKVTLPPPEKIKIINRAKPAGPVEEYRPYSPDANGVPALSNFGDDYILRVTGLVHDESGYSSTDPLVAEGLVRRLIEKIDTHREELPRPFRYGPEKAGIMLISFGIAARAAYEAVLRANEEGIPCALLQLRTIWPFPEEEVLLACAEAAYVIVVEMNTGQARHEVLACGVPKEKVRRVNRIDTRPVTPTQVLNAIREAAGR